MVFKTSVLRCVGFGMLFFVLLGRFAWAGDETLLIVRTPELAPIIEFDDSIKDWLKSKDSLRVAFWGKPHPPHYMDFETSTFEGVTADTLGLLQQMLGIPVKMLRYQRRSDAVRAVEAGEADMLALNSVEEPSSTLTATRPYLLNREVLVRRVGHPVASGIDSAGERIGYVADNDLQVKWLRENYPKSVLVPYDDYLNALAGLVYDQSDVLLIDAAAADFLISRFYRSAAYVSDATVPNYPSDMKFEVSSATPQLLEAVNQSLAAIPVASMLRITSNWGLNDGFVVPRPDLVLSQEQADWIAHHRTLKLGVVSSLAPMTFFDDKDQLQGLSADLAGRISQMIGVKFDVVRFNKISDLINALNDQSIDIAAAIGIDDDSISPKQLTRFYLVSPYVVVTRGDKAGIRSLGELNGLRLGLDHDGSLKLWLDQHYPNINQVSVQSPTQGIELLAAGELDGAVTTRVNAEYFISHHFQDELRIATVIGPEPAKIAMAVAPNNELLKGIINAALLAISPGELKDLSNLWRNNAAPAVASPWNSYRQTVLRVAIGALAFILLFLVWNYYLRAQIRKREKAERELEDQLRFTRTLIDGAPVALYVRNQEGRLVQCNKAYLDFFGKPREALIGTTLVESQAFDEEFSARYHQAYLEALKTGESTFSNIDVQLQGDTHRLSHWVLPFQNASGQFIGLIGGWLDITEREDLIEQLQVANVKAIEASHSKSVFLASMSHEIRTPVSALVGLIELLQLKEESAESVKESLSVAHDSAQSLLSLIGDILDLSKIEAGQMTPVFRPTNLRELVQSVYRLFEAKARSKNLECQLVCEIKNDGVLIDALMLNQIVANLLSNAIKFTDRGGVQVLLRELPEDAGPGRASFAIQVSDSGVGLSKEQCLEIFEPFVQTNPQMNRLTGTGLGLSICSSLAELLNAKLSVDSQQGLGSRFTLMFQADVVEIQAVPVLRSIDASSPFKLKILVVEDHAPNRLLLCRQLEHLGHEAWPSDNGETGLALWRQAEVPFDVTITDCGMPLMDGYRLAQRIREEEQHRAVRPHPIFGLTANAQPEIVERCIEAGMTKCLFKPLSVEGLAAELAPIQETNSRRVQAAHAEGNELEKIRLLSSESYVSLVQEILRSLRADALEIERLAQEDDLEAIARVAHKIRGGAHLAGGQELSEACRALELGISEGESTAAYSAQLETLLTCLRSLEETLLKQLSHQTEGKTA